MKLGSLFSGIGGFELGMERSGFDEWTKLRHDDSLVADGPRYKMLGNAVTVNVAEWIGRQLCVLKKR